MKFPMKLGIGCAGLLVFIIFGGFIGFPKLISSKIKSMVNLNEGTDIRGMFTNVPFGLDFRIFIFNVTNPMDIQAGKLPMVKEVGPFCYQEWKKKVDIVDFDQNDTMLYNAIDTFYPFSLGPECVSPDEMVTIPHPMILGMVNTVIRQKPGALTLVNKAIKSIYKDPESIFLTAKARDILFDGVIIDCGIGDFAGKAICTQLRGAGLTGKTETELEFSLFGPKNGTPSKRYEVYRGVKDFHQVGQIVKYDNKPTISNWPTDKCNEIHGTDGTIFPPFLTKEEGLVSFAPDLCRSLAAFYVNDTKYDGIPVRAYSANLGDMSKNEDEKCYCLTPETCLKKGMMDLYKCAGVPLYASLPHFLDSDPSYLDGVKGLKPQKEKHEILILFEPLTGGPAYAKKRLQFSMPMEPNEKVDIFKTLPNTIIPLFWIEEGVELNNTYTAPIKQLFMMKKVVGVSKWLILVGSLAGIGVAGYLHFKQSGEADITTQPQKVDPIDTRKTLNSLNYNMNDDGYVNHAMSSDDGNKY